MGTTTALNWPAGLGRTAVRGRWFARLSPLPPGLTLDEVARRLGACRTSAYHWAVTFGYRLAGRGLGQGWEGVDWGQSNAELARGLGVSAWAVGYQRHRRGLGSSADLAPANRFRAYVAERREGLHGRTVDEVLAASGCGLARDTVREILKAAGVRFLKVRPPRPPSKLDGADWRLPNQDLAVIRGVKARAVENYRERHNLPRPCWDLRRAGDRDDPEYVAAVRAEQRTVRKPR